MLAEPATRAGAVANVRESLRQGVDGAGWDQVTRVTAWGFEPRLVTCPVFLWWGAQDEPLADAIWLRDHIPDARLQLWPDEGHLAYKQHLDDIFSALRVHDSGAP